MAETPKDLQREGLSVSEACHVSGIGRNLLYDAMKDGSLPARKLGRRVIIMRSDLMAFMQALPIKQAAA